MINFHVDVVGGFAPSVQPLPAVPAIAVPGYWVPGAVQLCALYGGTPAAGAVVAASHCVVVGPTSRAISVGWPASMDWVAPAPQSVDVARIDAICLGPPASLGTQTAYVRGVATVRVALKPEILGTSCPSFHLSAEEGGPNNLPVAACSTNWSWTDSRIWRYCDGNPPTGGQQTLADDGDAVQGGGSDRETMSPASSRPASSSARDAPENTTDVIRAGISSSARLADIVALPELELSRLTIESIDSDSSSFCCSCGPDRFPTV